MCYYLFNWPWRDGRLSWLCWLTDSRRFTHKVFTRPSFSLAQDRESSPARTDILTTVLCHQLPCYLSVIKCTRWFSFLKFFLVITVIDSTVWCNCNVRRKLGKIDDRRNWTRWQFLTCSRTCKVRFRQKRAFARNSALQRLSKWHWKSELLIMTDCWALSQWIFLCYDIIWTASWQMQLICRLFFVCFYEQKQLLLSARLSHRNSVCLSVTRWISQ